MKTSARELLIINHSLAEFVMCHIMKLKYCNISKLHIDNLNIL